jgi:hypothetical protein
MLSITHMRDWSADRQLIDCVKAHPQLSVVTSPGPTPIQQSHRASRPISSIHE